MELEALISDFQTDLELKAAALQEMRTHNCGLVEIAEALDQAAQHKGCQYIKLREILTTTIILLICCLEIKLFRCD